jgi:hypothetical protein
VPGAGASMSAELVVLEKTMEERRHRESRGRPRWTTSSAEVEVKEGRGRALMLAQETRRRRATVGHTLPAVDIQASWERR